MRSTVRKKEKPPELYKLVDIQVVAEFLDTFRYISNPLFLTLNQLKLGQPSQGPMRTRGALHP